MNKFSLITISALLISVFAGFLHFYKIDFLIQNYSDSLINMVYPDVFNISILVFLEFMVASIGLLLLFLERRLSVIGFPLTMYIIFYFFDGEFFINTLAGLSYLQNFVLFFFTGGIVYALDLNELPAFVEWKKNRKIRKAAEAKAEAKRIALAKADEEKRIANEIKAQRAEAVRLKREAEAKEKRLKDLCENPEQWQNFKDGDICIGMHVHLVKELHGQAYKIRSRHTKTSSRTTAGFGLSRNSRGNPKFELEVTFDKNSRVVSYKT